MRVALCLSGMPREFDLTYKLLKKHIIDKYETDVFGAFWDDKLQDDNSSGQTSQHGHISPSEFANLCNPRSYAFYRYDQRVIDNLEAINTARIEACGIERIKHHARFAMLYLIEQSNNLKKLNEYAESKRYDVVVRCRTDMLIYNTPDFENMQSNTIYMSKYISTPGINDAFWYSDTETANKFCQIFSFIKEFDFSQLKVNWLAHEHIMQLLAMTQRLHIAWTDDQQEILRFADKEKLKNL